jgi:hypothetical protein
MMVTILERGESENCNCDDVNMQEPKNFMMISHTCIS